MSGLSSVMLSVMPSSSTMVMPTIRVTSPEPYTVLTGSENTLPGLVMNVPEVVTVISGAFSLYQNGLQRKFTAKLRCGLPRRIFSNGI